MSKDLVLYSNPMSRGRIARWMLEETGADYSVHMLDYATSMKANDYLRINPMGKVPAIVHGDTVVTECAAICAYLADAFPDAGLAPPPPDRGAYYRWLFFAAGPVEAAVSDRARGNAPTEEQSRMVGYGNYDTVLDVLEQAVSQHDYVTGDSFTAADVYLGAHIGWGMQFGTMDKREAFVAYWERLSSRAAHKRAVELDDAALAEMQKE